MGWKEATNSDWVSREGLIDKLPTEPRGLVFRRGAIYWKERENSDMESFRKNHYILGESKAAVTSFCFALQVRRMEKP